jgi:predicted nucleic acid-binding Zn ribbon protein
VKRRGRREPRPLGALVEGVLGDLGLDAASSIVRIAQCWPAAVGPEVAAHCRPSALRGTVLEATTDSSVWCQQLQLQRTAILAALRRELGDAAPTDLRFFVGSR